MHGSPSPSEGPSAGAVTLAKTAIRGESGLNLPGGRQAHTIVEHLVVRDAIGVGPNDPLQFVEACTDRFPLAVFPSPDIQYVTSQ